MTDAGMVIGALPEHVQKYMALASPRPMRVMAAQGLAPLAPRDLLCVLCVISNQQDDAELAAMALQTLAKLPDKMIVGTLGADLPPWLLGQLATRCVGRDAVLEPIVLHRDTPDVAIAAIAQHASEKIAELISSDQERCLRSEMLVRAIRLNDRWLKSSRERLFDFLVRSGVFHEDIPEFSDALARLSPKDVQAMADNVVLPKELDGLLQHGLDSVEQHSADDVGSEHGDSGASAEVHKKHGASTAGAEEDAEGQEKRISMLKLINTLTVAQRVALAMRGNKEARTILMRDPNRLVATAVIRSPRLTDAEVAGAASNRSVNDEVIRIICNSKEMTRSYGVKVALVNNPKTPVAVAMRILPALRLPDLKNLASSRGIPSGLANQAKILMRQRNG